MTRTLPITLVQCRYGLMFILTTDRYVGASLMLQGEWSPGENNLFQDIVQPNDTVVEVGAHIGGNTIPLARMVAPSGRVIAYEPQRTLYDVLRASIAINNLGRVVDLRLEAVGEASGELHAPAFDYFKPENFGGFPETLVGFTESTTKAISYSVVPMRTIDALKLSSCALIKADVEGMELAVISGAVDTIKRCRPALYAEAHRGKARALLLSLDAMGYRMWRHSPPLFSEENFRGARENPWPGIVSENILGLPTDRGLSDEQIATHSLRQIDDPFRDVA